jgi:predicted DNA-binding transcriptional regulator AlpA
MTIATTNPTASTTPPTPRHASRHATSAFTIAPAFMTAQQCADLLCISIRTFWRLVASGVVPQPVRWNRKLVRWPKAAIEHYLASLLGEFGAVEPAPASQPE